jgi:hypothetical protein
LSRVTYYWLLFISLAAGVTLFFCTPAGLGLTNDSAAYIGGARSILAGTGYSDVWLDSSLEALTHYPPLLSLTLSGIGLLGIDPYRGARLLNIFLFAANTGLIGLLGLRITKSQAAGIFLALLFATNAQLLKIHAYVLSEPLFLFFSLLSFLFFDFSLETRNSSFVTRYALLVTGLLTGLAFLTRYSGLALVATFLVSIFLFQPVWRSRFIKIAQFLAGTLPPIAAWFIRNALVAASATNRTFQSHPILLKNIRFGLRNFSQFLTPFENVQNWLFTSGFLTGLLVVIGSVLLVWLVYRSHSLLLVNSPTQPLIFTTVLYTFGYLGAVLFSMSFFDASTKFQHRILSPLYVSSLVLLVAILDDTARNAKFFKPPLARFAPVAVYFIVLVSLGFSTFDFQRTVSDLREAGQGYASWKWRDSIVMADLKKLPADVAIYTNTPPAVYLVLGRPSRVIPTQIDPVDNHPRGDYAQNLEQMRADLLAGRAVLALFDTSNIEDALGVDTIGDFSSGLTVLEKAQGDVLYGKP